MSSDPAHARIVQLRPDRLRAVGEVLSQSHAEYPAFRHTFPDPQRRRRALRRVFTGPARDALRFRSVYAAETADRQVHGVAIWLPPGRFPWSAWRQLLAAGWLLGVLLAAPPSFPTFMRTGMNAARLHPPDRHWYLETMGVAPSAQRLGLGGRLLAPVLELADRARADCYLETSDRANVRFYERHGFEVVDDALAAAACRANPCGDATTSGRPRERSTEAVGLTGPAGFDARRARPARPVGGRPC
jgi:ribosomal protein S18 acetylase RimI-like enzyme